MIHRSPRSRPRQELHHVPAFGVVVGLVDVWVLFYPYPPADDRFRGHPNDLLVGGVVPDLGQTGAETLTISLRLRLDVEDGGRVENGAKPRRGKILCLL